MVVRREVNGNYTVIIIKFFGCRCLVLFFIVSFFFCSGVGVEADTLLEWMCVTDVNFFTKYVKRALLERQVEEKSENCAPVFV